MMVFPEMPGFFAEAWIAVTAQRPCRIEEVMMARPTERAMPMPLAADRVPAAIEFFMTIMRMKPKIDWEEGTAERAMNVPCPSSTRDMTPCEAMPAIPQPIALP